MITLSEQVFWLMVHPTPRAFPSSSCIVRSEPPHARTCGAFLNESGLRDSGVAGFRPHLQRRDREGFPPSSLTQESQWKAQ